MPIDQFKERFRERKAEINENDVKSYAKSSIYNGDTPAYGGGGNSSAQMSLLIEKARGMGLSNFSGLMQHAANQNIKESAETILCLLEGKDISLYRDRTFACGPGTLTNLQGIILDISGLNSLESVVTRYKKEMLEEFAKEMLRGADYSGERVLKDFLNSREANPGMEVHYVSSILNVLGEEWGLIKKTQEEDVYIVPENNITLRDKQRIKLYVESKVQQILLTYDDIAENVLSKLEQGMPEFDDMQVIDEKYRDNFRESVKSELEKYEKAIGENQSSLLSMYSILSITSEDYLPYGYKENYRETLKNFLKLYLDSQMVISLEESEKKSIEDKLLIEKREVVQGDVTDELLKYGVDNDLLIETTIQKQTGFKVVDPIVECIRSGNQENIDFAKERIRADLEKYCVNVNVNVNVDIDSAVNNISSSIVENRSERYISVLQNELRKLRNNDVELTNEGKSLLKPGISYEEKDIEAKEEEIAEAELREAISEGKIIKTTTPKIVDIPHSIDPVAEYLKSGDEEKIQYARVHIENNCKRYGGNLDETINKINEEAIVYAELLGKLRYERKSLIPKLYEAARSGEAQVVGQILEAAKEQDVLKTMLTKKDKSSNTILHLAAENGNTEVIGQLLEAAKEQGILESVLSAKNEYDMTALHSAAENGRVEVIEQILEAAKNKGILEQVLRAKDMDNNIALHLVVENGRVEIIEKLLAAAKNQDILEQVLRAKGLANRTMLLYAAKFGKEEVVEKILDAAKDQSILESLLTEKDKYSNTILHLAAKNKNTEVVGQILAVAKDQSILKSLLTEKDKNGDIALHLAAKNKNTEVVGQILAVAKDQSILKSLLTEKDKNGDTVLHLAANNGKIEVVRQLLDAAKEQDVLKTMLTEKDRNGDTALHLVAENRNIENIEIFAELLDAAKEQDVLKTMLNNMHKRGLDISFMLGIAMLAHQAEVVRQLLDAAKEQDVLKTMLTEKDRNGDTALHLAANNGKIEVVRQLLDAAKEQGILESVLNAKNRDGNTALHLAAKDGKEGVVRQLLDAAKEQGILESVLNEKNRKGNTADQLYSPQAAKQIIKEYRDFINVKAEIFNDVRYSITPAKYSYKVPNFWVEKVAERGVSYWKERDALVDEVIGQHIKQYSPQDLVQNKEQVTKDIKEILNNKKELIGEFLNQTGHYNVKKENIVENMNEKKGEDRKSFTEKILEIKDRGNNNELLRR